MQFCARGNPIWRRKKIELHYEIEGYDRGEIEEQDLAKILIGILNWGENLVKREEHREIRMKITGVKNQLILECLTSSGRQNPMSRKLFRGLVKKYNGKMQEKKEKNREIWSDCYFVQVRQPLTESTSPLFPLRKAISSGWGLACIRRSASSF